MAILDSCLCCSLMVASFVVAVYDLVAYVIAFAVEFWWIMAAEEQLPAPAHVLCIEYFFCFILCAILLHGLSVKRGSCLMLWLITTVVFLLPEASLVLYMSFQHWRPNNLYGLTELTCWACRLVINVAGLISVQSLHSTWREEKHVMKRLHDLNMSSVASVDGRRSSVSSTMTGRGLHAHVNDGFLGSTPHLNGHSKALAAGSPPSTYSVPISRSSSRLKRSVSNASRRSKSSVLSTPLSLQIPLGGSAAHSPTNPTPLPLAPGALPLQRADSASEFNAAAFDGLIAAAIRGQPGALPLLSTPTKRPTRSRSMMELPQAIGGSNGAISRIDDYWSYSGGGFVHSLDRRIPRRCVSVADLRPFPAHPPPRPAPWPMAPPHPWVYVDPYGRPVAYQPDWYLYAASRNSLAASSGDLRRYRDVAL